MNTPLVWGHRGASGYCPENTMPAFEKAVEMKADGIELDIQLTKDGHIVICHDEWVDRTSDGTGWIKDFTLAELRALNFNTTHPELGNVKIPTIEEVYELIRPTGMTIDVELKNAIVFYPELEEKILKLTHDMGMEEQVIYSTFNHYSCRKLRALDPNIYIGLLYMDGAIGVPAYAASLGMNAVHPALFNLQHPDVAQECAKLGLEINTWTVNEIDHMKQCAALGVHTIITNYPDKALELYHGC